MATRAEALRTPERFIALGAPAQRLNENLDRKVPAGAKFHHIGAGYGDGSRCDGCNAPVEDDEVQFELEFRGGGEVIPVKLHVDCWESWRSERLCSAPETSTESSASNLVFVCTRHPDGRIVCNTHEGRLGALSALQTFLSTAQRMGYQVHESEVAENAGLTYLAVRGCAYLAFWLSETDESDDFEDEAPSLEVAPTISASSPVTADR
jgi:hypothetical protein